MYGENVHQDGNKEKDHPARRGTGTKNMVMELRTTQQTTKKKKEEAPQTRNFGTLRMVERG